MWHFSTEIEIRYAETDAMGLVHHSVYLIWFELARVRFFDHLGMPYHEMESKDWLIPVLEIRSQYMKPLRFGDKPQIKLRYTREEGSRFGFEYEVHLNGVCTSKGYSRHVVMNRQGRPQKPPQEFLALINSISHIEND